MRKTILAVDDSASIRIHVRTILSEAGYMVVAAKDGMEALKNLEKIKVDMIISDLNMPNMDGIELIRRVRRTDKHKYVPIVMLTSESEPELKMQGKKAGATGWIVKPFNEPQLLAVVARVIRR